MNPNTLTNTKANDFASSPGSVGGVHPHSADEVTLVPGHPGIPRHIAIIMDGNGRWAQQRMSRRFRGHETGVESVRKITTECSRLGLDQLTLYAFSVENWKRPTHEVAFLMRLLRRFVVDERPSIAENNIRFTTIGRTDMLPSAVQRQLDRTEELSAGNTGMNLCLALSYSGRAEIVDGARALAEKVRLGELDPSDIDEETFARHLYQPGPDPDLLIRTAGELRVSNFLLWQLSYSELYVTEICWPDFREAQLHDAIRAYLTRRRTFGGLEPMSVPEGARIHS